jgi:hypothetical protein
LLGGEIPTNRSVFSLHRVTLRIGREQRTQLEKFRTDPWCGCRMQVREAVLTRFVAHMSIHEFGLSYRVEATAIDAYVEHLNDRQQ